MLEINNTLFFIYVYIGSNIQIIDLLIVNFKVLYLNSFISTQAYFRIVFINANLFLDRRRCASHQQKRRRIHEKRRKNFCFLPRLLWHCCSQRSTFRKGST